MSAFSSQQRYDVKATIEATKRSTDPGQYMLDTNYANNCATCFAPYGPTSVRGGATVPGYVVDVDSILRGFTKIHSKSNEQQQPDDLSGYELEMPVDCNAFVETEYSRYTNPIQAYRGIQPDRFYELNQDPQCNIFWDFSVNTQLQARDNHVTDWQVPMNQRDLLPTQRLGNRRDCSQNLGCSYAPYDPSSTS